MKSALYSGRPGHGPASTVKGETMPLRRGPAGQGSGRILVARACPAQAPTFVPLMFARLIFAPLLSFVLLFLAGAIGATGARAAIPATADLAAVSGPHRGDHVVAELVADRTELRPGEPWRIGLKLRHDPGWHTYWRNPGDSGLPTQFEPGGPEGSRFGPIVWPLPERLAIGPLANYGYEGEVVLAREATVPDGLQGQARFEVHAQWLICREVCIPGEAKLALELPVVAGPSASGPTPWSADRTRFDEARAQAPDPAQARVVAARMDAGHLLLDLPEGLVAERVEFFPYFEGVVVPAADQRLYAAGTSARQRLDVAVAADAPPLPSLDADLRAGLIVADGKPLEVRLEPVEALAPAGSLVSVASVRQPSPGAGGAAQSSSGRGGLLSSLGAGTSANPPGVGVPGSGTADGSAGGLGSGNAGAASAAAVSTPLTSLFVALGSALIGGLLLNLMPCVFPVIGLKVLSFANAAEPATTRRRHAFAFAAGVILFLVLLAGLLLVLRMLGQSVGWGFQLQSPLFVAAMALLFVLIALNLFGVFEIGARLTTIQSGGEGSWGHFWAGAVAVLVATPCTAPFMAGAIGFTLGAGAFETLAIFVALGVGMAFPYVLFGLVPALLRWLPKPGPWLEGFRQLLGFPMLATAAWLAWVLMLQTGADGGLRLLAAAVLVGFAAWLHGRNQRRGGKGAGRRGWALASTLALVIGVAGAAWQLRMIDRLADEPLAVADGSGAAGGADDGSTGGGSTRGGSTRGGEAGNGQAGSASRADGAGGRNAAATSVGWQPWSTAAVDAARAAGRPVFVDFTAAWCISCQANKKLVLEREGIRQAFIAADMVALRADWTRADPAITAELARHGRNGVPLYLYYPARSSGGPRILPELLTTDIVLSAIAGTGPVGLLAR